MHIHIIKYVFSHYQIRISPPHFVCVYVYAGAINRPLQLLTVCNNAANTPPIPHVHHEIGCKTLCKTPTYTYEIGCEHSARRRGRFIVPVS